MTVEDDGDRYDLKDLEYWDERIREKVQEFGLDCYPQEFEICDHDQMLGYMAYSGMPSHYPHWSYGKAYEKLKTLYDYGVSGLPYEMVINSSPCPRLPDARQHALPADPDHRARLRPQRLLQEQLHLPDARAPSSPSSTFKSHADRVRRYVEDPSIGLEKVEAIARRRARAVAAVPAQLGDRRSSRQPTKREIEAR